MIEDGIKASFALGGITNAMVELLEEGLVGKIIDVQDFDHPSAVSLGNNVNHYEIDANMYASPLSKGAVINQLDTAILSALEIDTDFNVNVITGSDGVIRGASGGHSDTSAACKMRFGYFSELAARPLDPARPLWQLHLVKPYRGGSALIVRIHRSSPTASPFSACSLLTDANPDDERLRNSRHRRDPTTSSSNCAPTHPEHDREHPDIRRLLGQGI